MDDGQNTDGVTDEVGLFLRDDWQITPYLTLNVGVQFDSLTATGDGTALDPDRRLDFSLGDMIAPRASVIWDPFQKGRSRIFASYGRFSESVPMDVNDFAFGDGLLRLYFFDYPQDGSLPSYTNLGRLQFPLPDLPRSQRRPPISRRRTPRRSPSESSTSSRRASSSACRGIDRRIRNVVEDISVDGAVTYFVTNPGGIYTTNPVTGEPLAAPVTFPLAERKYHGPRADREQALRRLRGSSSEAMSTRRTRGTTAGSIGKTTGSSRPI